MGNSRHARRIKAKLCAYETFKDNLVRSRRYKGNLNAHHVCVTKEFNGPRTYLESQSIYKRGSKVSKSDKLEAFLTSTGQL